MQSRARRIAGFVLHFGLVYGVLVLAWPVLRPVYRAFYCALGNALFEGGEGSVRFQVAPPQANPGGEMDIDLVMSKRSAPEVRGRMKNNSRMVGYMPTVCLVAFVLASPIPWKRRRRALLLGLGLVTAFVALRMAIPIVRDFSNPNALQVYHLGAFGHWLLGVVNRALLSAPASLFVVPILIWVLVAFRSEDWELVLK